MKPEDYVKLPYHRVFIYDVESGGFTAFVFEFPGCVTEDETIHKANNRLNRTIESWVEAALSLGQTIPEPCEDFWKGALKCLGRK